MNLELGEKRGKKGGKMRGENQVVRGKIAKFEKKQERQTNNHSI